MRVFQGIAAAALAVGVAALIVGAIARVPDQALVELLRLVFSWPSVAALLGTIVLLNFHEQIGEYIQRIGNIEATTSGLKLTESQRQQPALTPVGTKDRDETAPLSAEQEAELARVREQFVQLQRDVEATRWAAGAWQTAFNDVSNRLQQKEMESNFWRFCYMAIYFAPVTHAVLRWMAAHTGRIPNCYYNAV